MKYLILSVFILFNHSGLVRAQLTRTEKKIVQEVNSLAPEQLELLKRVVNMNSGTMNFDGVQAVGKVLMEEFEALGFETSWVDGQEFGRAGHLLATHEGKPENLKVMLIGHLDTVFEPDHPYQSYTIDGDSVMRGPGVVDMKGGDVIILYALRAMREAGALKNMNVRVVMTGDEEKSGSPLSLSKQLLVETAEWADVAIGFENGDSNFKTAVISRRGSIRWKLEVNGNAAHSSQVFSEEVGAGAIYEASRILKAFYDELSQEPLLTFNPGVILGGTAVEFDNGKDGGTAYGKSNVVASEVVVSGDIRAVSPEQLAMTKETMERIVSSHLPGTEAAITFEEGYPPLPPTQGNRELLDLYSTVSSDLGLGPVSAVDPLRAGAADVSFTSGLVDAAMDGIGLSGGNDHTANEYADLNRLPDLTKRAALLLYRLNQKK
ncbi:M20 family metallopeptidase [Fulvivirga sedimenti]|uniref:M20 family metallopeptidase n=1 Tax=Fulvivirga sedimenti TaxID=2879465 RepID=A0A9X1HRS3_9BACT|nr:M20 family metallopeptidase [Fulvivirga sedimenti]MCA6074804.1 M20 family metallopeptidase [Fulvivirga sedimenti]MCA6075981.1 M20 family metallopeptidase [Fulvivirga sedimenti]MCA6077109.1 M20 family metallopeptidase [Fulvivirga sedimenti]